jgi:hypothetical protein
VRAEAFPDFGMITSLAGDRYREQFGVDGAKTVFVRNGYYFGYGVTTRAELAVRFHAWSAGAETRWERFGSFDVRDRFQEELTNDFHLTDGRTSGTLWTTLTPKPGFGQVGAALQRIVRWGTIDDMTEERREDRAALTFALVF